MKHNRLLSQHELIKRINRNTRASYQLFDQLLSQRPPVFFETKGCNCDHIGRRLKGRGDNNNN